MKDFDYYKDMDSHPFTGMRDVDFDAKISNAPWLKCHFDGSKNAEQVTGVTQGRVYHITKVEGFGDVADFIFVNDNGEERRLGSFFFEKPKNVKVNIIVARSRNNAIGTADGIPWKIKGEQAQFKELTMGEAVVMGRKTYEDIGHPLKGRLNIVVSNTKDFGMRDDRDPMTTAVTVRSFDEALELVEGMGNVDLYVAGGRQVYAAAMPHVTRMYITEVDTEVPDDGTAVYFPEFDTSLFDRQVVEPTIEAEIPYTRTVWVRKGAFQ